MSDHTETRPPEGLMNLEFILEHFGDEDRVHEAESELSALRARCEQLRGERDERAMDITQADANELQDILRTLTASGTALKTSARELVERWKALGTERDALRAANERLRWLLEVAVDYRDRPAGVSDEDWSRWKTESTTALGNAQEARDAQP